MEFELCCFDADSAIRALVAPERCVGGDVPRHHHLPDRIELCSRQDIDGASPTIEDVRAVLNALAGVSSSQLPAPRLSVMARAPPMEKVTSESSTLQSQSIEIPLSANVQLLGRGLPFVLPGGDNGANRLVAYLKEVCNLIGGCEHGVCSAVVEGVVFGALRLDIFMVGSPGSVGGLPIPVGVARRLHQMVSGDDLQVYFHGDVDSKDGEHSLAYFKFGVDRAATQAVRAVVDGINCDRAGVSLPPVEVIFHRAADVLLTQDALLPHAEEVTLCRPPEWLVWLGGVADRLLTSGGPHKLLGTFHSSRGELTGVGNIVNIASSCMELLNEGGCPRIMLAGGVNEASLPAALDAVSSLSGGCGGVVVAFHGSLLQGHSQGEVSVVRRMLEHF